jgi:hypothetical protein
LKHKFISGFQIIFEGILLTLEGKAYTFATEIIQTVSRWPRYKHMKHVTEESYGLVCRIIIKKITSNILGTGMTDVVLLPG